MKFPCSSSLQCTYGNETQIFDVQDISIIINLYNNICWKNSENGEEIGASIIRKCCEEGEK